MRPKKLSLKLARLIKRLSADRPEYDLVRLNVIWLLTLLVTVGTLTMFWVEFLLPGYHVGLTRSFVYYTMLTFYVSYKEIYRWLGRHREKRAGSVWVVIWWSSVFLMEIVSFACREQYCPLAEQYAVALAVSVNFLASWISKHLYERKRQS